MRAVVLPDGVREVLIAADNDPAGEQAARALARRLHSEGRSVRIAIPPQEGDDWADVIAQCRP
jgi:DNA primase